MPVSPALFVNLEKDNTVDIDGFSAKEASYAEGAVGRARVVWDQLGNMGYDYTTPSFIDTVNMTAIELNDCLSIDAIQPAYVDGTIVTPGFWDIDGVWWPPIYDTYYTETKTWSGCTFDFGLQGADFGFLFNPDDGLYYPTFNIQYFGMNWYTSDPTALWGAALSASGSSVFSSAPPGGAWESGWVDTGDAFTITLFSDTYTIPLKRNDTFSADHYPAVSFSLEPVKYWSYKDAAGVALYDETTGAPI